MCKQASFIITKERIFFSKISDRHSRILEEFGITGEHVAVEISPKDNDYRLPLKDWQFRIDSNFPLPEWWNGKWGEQITREELPKWAKYHLFKNKKNLKFSGEVSVILINCKDVVIDNQSGGNCWFYDNSTGTVSNQSGGNCRFSDNSTGTVSNQSGGDCWFSDNSTGTVSNQSGGNCWFSDNSTGTVSNQTGGNCWFYDNSTGTVSNQSGGDCWFYDNSTNTKI
jgi:hypothetical protein